MLEAKVLKQVPQHISKFDSLTIQFFFLQCDNLALCVEKAKIS